MFDFLFLRTYYFSAYSENMSDILLVTEEDVKSFLDWDSLYDAIKQVMSDVSLVNHSESSLVIQPARSFMIMKERNGVLLTMPSLTMRKRILSCKLVTSFLDNPKKYNLPSILANVLLFDPDTGKLKAVVEGITITEWRTAAASAVATYCMKPSVGSNCTLTVFGAGAQARSHILAFWHFFKFGKINLWNRTYSNGLKLATWLKTQHNIDVEVFHNKEDAVKSADVVVTATYSSEPLIRFEDLKKGVMINAVGAGVNHHSELDKSVYANSSIYTDSMENARVELKGLIDDGFPILGEIGEIINNQKKITNNNVIIFHSLGMGVEDGVTAGLVLEKYIQAKSSCSLKSSSGQP